MANPTPQEPTAQEMNSQEELKEQVRALQLPNTRVYSTDNLTIGNLVDTSLEVSILHLIEAEATRRERVARIEAAKHIILHCRVRHYMTNGLGYTEKISHNKIMDYIKSQGEQA